MVRLKITYPALLSAFGLFMSGIMATPAMASQDIGFNDLFKSDSIDPWSVCQQQTALQEGRFRIPRNLLHAISLAESGRYNAQTGENIAWPWTVTYGGKGRYFDTLAEAKAEVEIALTEGVQNIDVGCMQVNLMYHPDAFSTLDDAFDPAQNTAYAARFLKSIQAKNRNWGLATGVYHSSTKSKAQKYRRRVFKLMRDAKSTTRTKSGNTYLIDHGRTQKITEAFKARKQRERAERKAVNNDPDQFEKQRQIQLAAWRKAQAQKRLGQNLGSGQGLKFLLDMRRAEQATARQKQIAKFGKVNKKAALAQRRRSDLDKWRKRYSIAAVETETPVQTTRE